MNAKCARFFLMTGFLMSQEFEVRAAAGTTMELGGPRQVIASVVPEGDNLEVEVRFLAVHCFDPGTNRKVNQQKAQAYAAMASARHLGIGGRGLIVRGIKVLENRAVNERWIARFHVPKVAVQPAEEGTVPSAKLPLGSTDILSMRDDYIDTARLLGTRELTSPQSESEEEFNLHIMHLEQEQVEAFDALTREVREQPLLLDVEKAAVLSEIESARTVFIDQLTQLVQEGSRHAP